MIDLLRTYSAWGLGAILVLGLLSAWMTRLSEGSRFWHRSFFVCLLFVGLATIASSELGAACWISSGTTFSLMVLTATCDFGREDPTEFDDSWPAMCS